MASAHDKYQFAVDSRFRYQPPAFWTQSFSTLLLASEAGGGELGAREGQGVRTLGPYTCGWPGGSKLDTMSVFLDYDTSSWKEKVDLIGLHTLRGLGKILRSLFAFTLKTPPGASFRVAAAGRLSGRGCTTFKPGVIPAGWTSVSDALGVQRGAQPRCRCSRG